MLVLDREGSVSALYLEIGPEACYWRKDLRVHP